VGRSCEYVQLCGEKLAICTAVWGEAVNMYSCVGRSLEYVQLCGEKLAITSTLLL